MNTTRSKNRQRLQERETGGRVEILREQGLIRGVRIVGTKSRNRRRYLSEALRQAIPLYEGAKVYIDHVDPKASKERPMRERWAKLQDVRQESDGSLVGDLAYLKSHRDTEAILEAAEKFSDFGLSHDILGATRNENGERVVYEIAKVYSVDVVGEPATNENLFESETMSKKLLATLREHKELKPAGFLLGRLQEMADIYPESMPLSADDMADAKPEDQVREAIKTAVNAILDMDIAPEEMLAKIKILLDVKTEVADGKPAEELAKAQESVSKLTKELEAAKAGAKRLQESAEANAAELITIKARAAAESLLVKNRREVTDVRVKALMALQESERPGLVESWPEIDETAGGKRGKPERSQRRFQESREADDELAKLDSPESVAKFLGVKR